MPDQPSKFYLTTPIYYVNARPHIGHAYTTIAADVLARRHRLLGEDVFFLTGTDEHGQKIERSAAAAGIPPQQFADEVAASFKALWQRMGITNDKFIRTTSAEHKRGVQKLFRKLQETGAIYLDSYTGAYCVSDETFVDLPAGTPCPDCGRPLEIVTEENYFFKLSAYQDELIKKIESGELSVEPEARRNEVLSFVRGGLKDLSISRTSFRWGVPVPGNDKHVIYVWLDALANYITAIGYGADTDASLTAEQREEAAASFEKYWPADLHLVGKEIIRFHCVYWPAFLLAAGLPLPKKIQAHGWLLFEESKMSKSRGNIVRTETILDAFGDHYRASIIAHNKKLAADHVKLATEAVIQKNAAILSEPQPAHSKNAVILSEARSAESKDLHVADAATTVRPLLTEPRFVPEPTKEDADLFAADVLRYFLLREIPFGQDGSFSFDALITRYNADLANGYGNLVSRTLTMIEQHFSDGLPKAAEPWLCRDRHVFWQTDAPTQPYEAESGTGFIIERMTSFLEFSEEFHVYLAQLTLRISHVDHYLSFHKPWILAKSSDDADKKKLIEVLNTAAESIRIITAILHPVMPHTTAKVWAQLGLDPADLDSTRPATSNQQLATLSWGGLKPGTKLGPLAPIFPRAPKELAQVMSDIESQSDPAKPATNNEQRTTDNVSAAAPSAQHPAPSASPLISIDDFAKVDLRVARVLVAERIPKADKLLRLEVDLGPSFDPPTRQILAGIAQFYEPEKLVGRKVVIVANLAPRRMRGLESQGMVVAASIESDGAPVLASFLEDVEIGARLK